MHNLKLKILGCDNRTACHRTPLTMTLATMATTRPCATTGESEHQREEGSVKREGEEKEGAPKRGKEHWERRRAGAPKRGREAPHA